MSSIELVRPDPSKLKCAFQCGEMGAHRLMVIRARSAGKATIGHACGHTGIVDAVETVADALKLPTAHGESRAAQKSPDGATRACGAVMPDLVDLP